MSKIFPINIVFILISFSLVLSACSQFDVSQISDEDIDRITNTVIVCNAPYIRHGVDCCLDIDDNGICDRDEEDEIEDDEDEKDEEEIDDEEDEIEDEKNLQDKTNQTEESIEKTSPMNQEQIEETIEFFTDYIEDMEKFDDLEGHSLSKTLLKVDIDSLYTEFLFYPKVKNSKDNTEYYKVTINGSYMKINDINLYEISHLKWNDVDEEKQDILLVKCIQRTNTNYYANQECCNEQNDLLGNVFFNYGNMFYVNCADNMDKCTDAGIKGLPTWMINGTEKFGTFSKAQLAEFMGCVDIVSKEIEI